jgi:hypothetical protein
MRLKSRNFPYLAAFLLAQGAAHLLVLRQLPVASLVSAAAPDWRISVAASAALMVVVFVLSDLLSDTAKARLVFWKWHHPLPASMAFTRYALEDARVDPVRLAQKYGPLPADPMQQNRLWYNDVYKPNRDKAGISQSHGRYLLLRDLAAIGCIIALPLACSAFAFSPLPTIWIAVYAAGLVLQVFIVSEAAANSGVRFVKNALAEACA